MQTHIDLEFADGSYTFRLGLAQVAILQDKCGCGIGALYARLMRGRYLMEDVSIGLTTEAEFRAEDVVEVIRQGLIGGGKGEVDGTPVLVSTITANKLVAGYVFPERPLKEGWNVAVAVLMACVEGYTPKKAEPAAAPATETQKAASTSRKRSPTAR